MESVDWQRRALLGAALATVGATLPACGTSPPPQRPSPPPPPPPLLIGDLVSLLPVAGLDWIVVVRPASLLALEWLKPSLSRVLRDERLDLLAATTGVDLRQASELALSSHGEGQSVLYLVRHAREPIAMERLFRQRLTGGEQRAVDEDSRLVRVSGRIGRQDRVFVALGDEVAGFQYGGDVQRGPARVAMLFAAKKLQTIPTLPSDEEMGPIWEELAEAPARALVPGPFEGAAAQGARGLLGAATCLGASASPAEQESLRLTVLLGGDFTSDADGAERLWLAAWNDVADSDLGHLLRLNEPRGAPASSVTSRRLRLDVSLDPAALLDGLAAATTDDIREIMR